MTFNYRTTRGTFKLGTVRKSVLNNEYVPVSNVWLPQDDIGHSRPFALANLQRWNLGTATLTSSPLTCSRYWGQASGNTTFSYFASGSASPGMAKKTNTDKLTYSPYAITATPTANLTTGMDRGGASSSNLAAYFSAGVPAGSWVDKIVFATDTKSTLSDDFGVNNNTFASLADGAGGGYLFESGQSQSKTYKITYSTDGIAHLPGSNLVNYTTESNGEMMSRTAGYKSGGAASSPAASSITNKLSYSNTTWSAVPGGKLPIAKRRAASGTGRSKGFVGGGDLNVVPVYTDFALLDFSTDTFAQEPSLNFSSNHGYYTNKSTTTPLDGLYGADKAADRNSFWSGDDVKRWTDDSGQSPNTSYILYGHPLGGDTYKLNLSTETGADTPSAQLPSARRGLAGTGNKTQGYFSSGYNSGSTPYVVSNTDKLTYSNDTCARLPGSNMPGINGLQYHTAISSETNGYFWAGLKEYPTVYTWTKIYKITYSTDAMSTNPSNMTGSGNYRGGSTNSATAGYESGGATLNDNAIKYTFSTETAGALPGFLSDVSQPRAYCIATGNQTAGYWAGGSNYSRVAKVTWATETAEWTPGNLENGGLTRMNATSNTEKGYWIGGYPQPNGKTSVTTFATDTHARNPSVESLSPAFTSNNDLIRASVGGRQSGIPVTIASETTSTATSGSWQYQLSPGVPNHGYYLGGGGNHDQGSTNSMKFSFATDTFDNSVRLSERFTNGTMGGKMASSPTHGYAVYGRNPNAPGGETGNSWVRKVQYSNDTGTSAPNAPNEPSYSGAVAGSTTNLYLAGGIDNHNIPLGARTNVRKLTYSNDTWPTVSQSNANYSEPSGWPRKNFNSGGTQTYALWGWGTPTTYRTYISKYTYASDTGVMGIPGVTADYSQGYGQVGNSNSTHWWLARGGTSNGGPFQSQISRWTFATDTAQFPTTLTDQWYDYGSAQGTGAINDGMTAGYWSGGHGDQSDSTSTLKVSYATETASRGTDIPAGRHPSANGSYNGYSGTSVREWGAETTQVPNFI